MDQYLQVAVRTEPFVYGIYKQVKRRIDFPVISNLLNVLLSVLMELLLPVVGMKGELILWDIRSGQQKNTLTGHTSNVYSVSFSRDGSTLASGDREKTIHLWDVETGELKKTLSDHDHYVSVVLFSPDGEYLASGSWDDTIRLWDADTYEHKRTFVLDTVSSLSITPDGKTLAGGSVFSRNNPFMAIRLWNVKTGQVKRTFMGHTDWIFQVMFSPDGETLATASRDGTILLWDVTSLSKVDWRYR